MIQVTDKYGIQVTPDCYAVAVRVSNGEKGPTYACRYFYDTFEDALIKISKLIERDSYNGSTTLEQAIDRLVAVHFQMQEYIKEACRQYAYRDDN